MKLPRRRPAVFSAAALLAAVLTAATLSSCITLSQSVELLTSQAVSQGLLNHYQASMLRSAAAAAKEATRVLTPEEEYYVGRAVAAQVFQKYSPYDRRDLNAYLNRLGQGLALYSSRPEIFAGYRFIALQSAEVNAFATPGGHVLVTRGLLGLVKDEDELAAVLAHEIAHVALGHGLSSVQGARLTQIASDFAMDAGMSTGGSIAAFTSMFGESIAELAGILIVSGYSQTYELEADREAVRILSASGYDRNALARLIGRLPRKSENSAASSGFAVTHPEPLSRLEALARTEAAPASTVPRKPVRPLPGNELSASGADGVAPAVLLRRERFETMRVYF